MADNLITGSISDLLKCLPETRSKSFPKIGYAKYLRFNRELYVNMLGGRSSQYNKTSLELFIDEIIINRIESYNRAINYENGIMGKDLDSSNIIFQYASTPYALNRINYTVRVLIASQVKGNSEESLCSVVPVMILENPLPQDPKESRLVIDEKLSVDMTQETGQIFEEMSSGMNDYLSRNVFPPKRMAEVVVIFDFLRNVLHQSNGLNEFFRQASLDVLIDSAPETYFMMYDDLFSKERDRLVSLFSNDKFRYSLVNGGLVFKNEVYIDILNASCCGGTHLGPFYGKYEDLTVECEKAKRKTNVSDSKLRFKKALLNPVIAHLYNAVPIMSIRPNSIAISNIGISIIGVNSDIAVDGKQLTIPALGYDRRALSNYLNEIDLSRPISFSYKHNQQEFIQVASGNLKDTSLSIIEEREIARKNRDYDRADLLRDALLREGIEIRDHRNKTYIRRIK